MEVRYELLPAGTVVCQESRDAVLQKKRGEKLCLKVTINRMNTQSSSWSDLGEHDSGKNGKHEATEKPVRCV